MTRPYGFHDAEGRPIIPTGSTPPLGSTPLLPSAPPLGSTTPPPLEQAFRLTAEQKPDTAARVLRMQAVTGLPPALIQGDLDQIEKDAAVKGFDAAKYERENPRVAQWLLKNEQHPPLAREDLPALSNLEHLVYFARDFVGAAYGVVGQVSSLAQTAMELGAQQGMELAGVPKEIIQDRAAFEAMMQAVNFGVPVIQQMDEQTRTFNMASQQIIGRNRPAMSPMMEALHSGMQSVGQMVPMIIGSLLGAPEVLGLASFGVTSGGAAATQAREEGLDPLHQMLYAAPAGAIEVATEKLPFELAAHHLSKFGQRLMGAVTAPAAEVEAKGFFRAALKFAKTTGEQVIVENLEEQVGTWVGDFNTWAQIERNKGKTFEDFLGERWGAAKQTAIATTFSSLLLGGGVAGIERLNDIAVGRATKATLDAMGKTVQGSEVFKLAPEKIREAIQHMDPKAKIEVPAEDAATYLQEKGIDPGKFFEGVTPGGRELFEQAPKTGGVIELPQADYVVNLAHGEHAEFFNANARFIDAEGKSRHNRVESDQLIESLKADLTKAAEALPERVAAGEQIRQNVTEQLMAVGYDKTAAEAQAAIVAKGFVEMSARSGDNPMAIFQQYNPRITRPMPEILKSVGIEPLLDQLRAGEQVTPPTETQVPQPGEAVPPMQTTGEADLAAQQGPLQQLSAYLTNLGIDPKTATNEEIQAAIQQSERNIAEKGPSIQFEQKPGARIDPFTGEIMSGEMQDLEGARQKLEADIMASYESGNLEGIEDKEAKLAIMEEVLQANEDQLRADQELETAGEGASIEEQLATSYADYQRGGANGMTQADILANMRATLDEAQQGGATPADFDPNATDEQILAAAKDAYERQQQIRETLKNAKPNEVERIKARLASLPKTFFQKVRSVFKPHPDQVATRQPTDKKKAALIPQGRGTTGLEAMKADPEAFAHNIQIVTQYPNYRPGPLDENGKPTESIDQQAERFINHLVDNIVWMFNRMPREAIQRARLWYAGAQRITNRLAQKYNLPVRVVAGVMARLSPKQDWFNNETGGERTIHIWSTQQKTMWSPEMTATAEKLMATNAKQEAAAREKKLRKATLPEILRDFLGVSKANRYAIYDKIRADASVAAGTAHLPDVSTLITVAREAAAGESVALPEVAEATTVEIDTAALAAELKKSGIDLQGLSNADAEAALQKKVARKLNAARKKKAEEDAASPKKPRQYFVTQYLDMAQGKTLADATGKRGKALWVRIYDLTYNKRHYREIMPEGEFGDYIQNDNGKESDYNPGMFDNNVKAIEMLMDQRLENISRLLGSQHKIRNFYNNILDPNDPDHVTVDTHAIALGVLAPIGSSDPRITQGFGGGKTKRVGATGMQGVYGLYHEAYSRAAAMLDMNLLPRELQSITWEGIRAMWPDKMRTKKAIAENKKIWLEYRDGKIEADEARRRIAATGLEPNPQWGRPSGGNDPRWDSSYTGELARSGTWGRPPTARPTAAGLRDDRSRNIGRDTVGTGRDAGGSGEPGRSGRAGVAAGEGEAEPGSKTLEQRQGKEPPRGSMTIAAPNATGQRQVNIKLYRDANLSTFLHESTHLFFEVFLDITDRLQALDPATLTHTQEQMLADRATLFKKLGIESRDQIEEKHHEQVARLGEAFFREGKAPSAELRPFFNRFAGWLGRLYSSLRQLGVKMDPEVHQVFARWFASDEAIKKAESEANAHPVWATQEESGLDDHAWAAYQGVLQKAHDAGVAKLFQDQRQQEQRVHEQEWKDRRAAMREQVAAEAQQMPVYRALSVLKDGKLPTGEDIPGGQAAIHLDATSIERQYGEAVQKSARNKDNPGSEITNKLLDMRVYRREGGITQDVAAEQLGFDTGHELILAIIDAPDKQQYIDVETDMRMRQQYGDMMLDGSLDDRAMAEVVGPRRSEVIALELKSLAKRVREAAPERAAERSRKLAGKELLATGVPDKAALKQAAADQVRGMPLEQIRPDRWLKAASRASAQAIQFAAQGKHAEALAALTNELMNVELYQAGLAVKEHVEASRKMQSKLWAPNERIAKTRNMDFVTAARAISAAFMFPGKQAEVTDALKMIEKYNPDQHAMLMGLIEPIVVKRDEQGVKIPETLASMSYGDFVAVDQTIKSLWAQAKAEQEAVINGNRVRLDEIRTELKTQLAEHKPVIAGEYPETSLAPKDSATRSVLTGRAWAARVSAWVSYMDLGNPSGPFNRFIWRPIHNATTAFKLARLAPMEKFVEILKPISGTVTSDAIPAPELGIDSKTKKPVVFRQGRKELLHALLQTGNLSNLTRMLVGMKWGSIREDGTLDRSKWDAFLVEAHKKGIITEADWKFVQGVWDILEGLKPEAQAAHKAMFGVPFDEITAAPVQTPWGELKGGYFPVVYNPETSRKREVSARSEIALLTDGDSGLVFPTTGHNWAKNRVDPYAQPLLFDLSLVQSHIDKVLRFIHIEPAVKDVAKLIWRGDFANQLHQHDPAVISEMLIPWLQRTASQRVNLPIKYKKLERFTTWARGLAGVQSMALNIINGVQNIPGVLLGMAKWVSSGENITPMQMVRAGRQTLWGYVHAGPGEFANSIANKSGYMKTRLIDQAQVLQSGIHDVLLNPSLFSRANDWGRRQGSWFQKALQNVVDQVVWTASYNQYTEQKLGEAEAVQRADFIIRTTQDAGAPEDIARWEAGPAPLRLFTMFSGWQSMQSNLMGSEYGTMMRQSGLRNGAGKGVYLFLMAFMVPTIIGSEIARLATGVAGGGDDDDESWLDAVISRLLGPMARSGFGLLPFGVGPAAWSAAHFLADSQQPDIRFQVSPVLGMLESTLHGVKAVPDLYESMTGEWALSGKEVQDLFTLAGVLASSVSREVVPLAGLRRPFSYLSDVESGRIEPEGPVDVVRGLVSGRGPKKE